MLTPSKHNNTSFIHTQHPRGHDHAFLPIKRRAGKKKNAKRNKINNTKILDAARIRLQSKKTYIPPSGWAIITRGTMRGKRLTKLKQESRRKVGEPILGQKSPNEYAALRGIALDQLRVDLAV